MSWNIQLQIFFKTSFKAVSFTVLVAGTILFSKHDAKATHAAGADLTYRCLGGLVYQVEATFYRDCGGTPEPGNLTITYKSSTCAYSRTAIANKFTGVNGEEITLPCNTSPSSCNGGFTTGLRKWVYRATITLPYACSDWVFSYRVCCRNCTVTTIQSPCAGNSELYVEATLDNISAPCNNSPLFSNSPIAFVCLGQNFNYNQGVYDIDGDSLSYELITPKISATAEVTWLAPATQQSPLASSTPFTINAITGDINFTPSAMQIGILAVRVNEFRGGVPIGSTVRDMQVYTQNCFNSIPSASPLDSTGSFIANVCAGQQLCFTISTFDSDSTQVVTGTYNNLPTGATLIESPGNRPSYQFCWTPTQGDVSRIPKTFTFTVRDNACPYNGVQTFSYSVLVGGPEFSVITADPTCSGMNNGTASLTGTGLTGSTILWNTVPPQHSMVATGLEPGNYSVIVTDAGGCSSTENFNVNASANSLTVEATSSGFITCQSGNIGQAQVTVTNGQSPFSFQWSNGATTSAVTGLGAGTYLVTVQDANGCSVVDTVIIQQVSGTLTASVISAVDVDCNGGNTGAVTINVSGGTTPYTYLWNTGESTAVIQNLISGSYTVNISDVNGCTAQLTVAISQPDPIFVTGNNVVPASCFGSSNGSISTTVNGGNSPYQFVWSNGQTSLAIQNLVAGIYTLTVTDANGCSHIYSESITQPIAALNVAVLSSGNINCSGDSNGFIQSQATGGSSPYSYVWNNGSSSANLTAIPAGNYTLTVTDVNGCSSSLTQIIEQPELAVSVIVSSVNHITCSQSAGSIDMSGLGGTAPLQFLWSNGATTEDIQNLTPGWYTITVTDANGCTSQATAEIKYIGSAISLDVGHIQDVLCYNMSNGIIDINVSGGDAPYIYQWSNGATTDHIQNLPAGFYTLTVTDANGCTNSSIYTINQPAAPLIPLITIHQQVSCFNGSNGQIGLVVNGGTTPYNFTWSNGIATQNLSGLNAGTYTVTVTDANGCNAIINAIVSQPLSGLSGTIALVNPVSCHGGSNANVICNIEGGTLPYSFQWNTGAQTQALSNVASGSYTVTVTDAAGCTYLESIIINQPVHPLSVSGSAVNPDCLNNSGGSITTAVSGGSAPYSYLWNNGQTASNQANLIPGIYIVTITDANGCTAVKTFGLESTTQLTVTTNGPTTICAGEMITMNADTSVNGTFQWYFEGNALNGATGSTFTTPAAGSYTVTMTNSCGTFVSDTIEVEVKSIGNVSITNQQIICPPETATLVASGGVTYNWSPASYITFTNVPDPIVSPQVSTVYTVEITNEFGCKTSLNTNVAVMCDSLLVPTGFSPNDDGVNDGYVIDGIENYPGNKLWVYNRWGKLVYKATDYMNSWNGVSNISGIYMGKKVGSGTYYYILDLNDRSKPRAGYLIIRH